MAVPFELILADGSVFPARQAPVRGPQRGPQDRHVCGRGRVSESGPAPSRAIRPRTKGHRHEARRHPRAAAGRAGRPGHEKRLVVGADNTVEIRMVKPAERIGELLVVRSGVKPGERIVVEGLQKVRPGFKVKPSMGPPAALRKPRRGRTCGKAGRGEARAEGRGEIVRGQLLHPAADRRDRHRDHHRAARPQLAERAAASSSIRSSRRRPSASPPTTLAPRRWPSSSRWRRRSSRKSTASRA